MRPMRGGQTLVLIAFAITTLSAIAGIAIDLGLAMHLRARMQSACDAAALAGAVDLTTSDEAALTAARRFAAFNGFTHGEGCTVDGARATSGPGRYSVSILQDYGTLFVHLVGARTIRLGVQATAEYVALLPVDITGGGLSGTNDPATLEVFGPYAYHSYGDAYSVRWLDNGQPNPSYRATGYDFTINVPADYVTRYGTRWLNVELYDPDCGNPDDATNGMDEVRNPPPAPHPQLPPGMSNLTTTRYQLFAPAVDPQDHSSEVPIATATYGRDPSVSDRWVSPTGFTVDVSAHPPGAYRLNVTSIAGSSENGYNVRAAPPGMDFQRPSNTPGLHAMKIDGVGILPLNLNRSATLDIDFGAIPATSAGYRIHVQKFDTDVGATSLTYRDSRGNSWPGTLAGNDQTREDIVTIPAGYPGGTFRAVYVAGALDTSSWAIFLHGLIPGQPGRVRLVE